MFVRTLYAKPFSVKTSHFARSSHLYVGWCRNEWFFCYLKIGRFAPKKHAKLFYFHNLCVLRPQKYAVKAVRCSSALCLFMNWLVLNVHDPTNCSFCTQNFIKSIHKFLGYESCAPFQNALYCVKKHGNWKCFSCILKFRFRQIF